MSAAIVLWLALAAPAGSVGECPAPDRVVPAALVEPELRTHETRAVVEARLDACGRVVEARLLEASSRAVLDAAALAAARASVIDPALARDGRVRLPYRFAPPEPGSRDVVRVDWWKTGWPASHARPRYVLEALADHPDAASTIAAVRADPTMHPRWSHIPFAHFDERLGATPREFWLSFDGSPESRGAAPPPGRPRAYDRFVARYRLEFVGGVPVVRIAFACSAPRNSCRQARAKVARGLPFARPPFGRAGKP